jgi:hypothetical protein
MYGQYNNRYWCFGDSAGIDFSNLSMPATFPTYMDCPYSSTSIGDSLGLLMYAHTVYWPLWIAGSERTTVVHNRYHDIMENGDSLISNAFYNGLTFINKPSNDSLFYLFQWGFSPDAGLYYSLIDPYFNNDSGIVILKNVKLNLSNDTIEVGVNAIRHGNGRDWWIVTRNGTNSNLFNLYFVSPDSIVGPFEQHVGTITITNGTQLNVSKEGDKICLVSYPGNVEVYDFDRCSGIISNPISINLNLPVSAKLSMGEFSPNGQLLYVVSADNIFGDSLRLYQINLSNPDPSSAVEIIYKEKVPASGGNLRRGPDDKIYLTCLYEVGWPYPDTCRNIYNENLSVINSPDSIGLACNFIPFNFYLGGKRSYWSLPNIPNFQLGELIGSACDSLMSQIPVIKNDTYELFPNPANDNVKMVFNNDFKKIINVFDIAGRNVFSIVISDRYITLDLSIFTPGVYYIHTVGYMTSKLLIVR